MKLQYNSELRHFGIKGMHWGIRRFQNKDGTLTEAGKKRILEYRDDRSIQMEKAYAKDKKEWAELGGYDGNVIRKGSRLYRVSTKDEKIDSRRKYVTVDDKDADSYAEAALDGDIARNAKSQQDLRMFTYEAKTDIKVVTAKQQYDYVYEKYGDTKVKDLAPIARKGYERFVKKYGNTPIRDLRSDFEFVRKNLTSGNYEKDRRYKKIYDYRQLMYNLEDAFFRQTLWTKTATDVISDKHYEMQEHYKKLGYKALIDIEDVDISVYPMILMSPNETIKQVSKTKILRGN